jgi:peptidoglycan/LPS O-acetylase OafA/YrhL
MLMSNWRSGDIVSAAAGFALLVALAVPWVLTDTVRPSSPLAAGAIGTLAWIGLSGAVLAGFALKRSAWTALVGFSVVLVAAFGLYTAAIPAHAAGAHPGFGMYALAAGAVLAAVGAVLNAIEREATDF